MLLLEKVVGSYVSVWLPSGSGGWGAGACGMVLQQSSS